MLSIVERGPASIEKPPEVVLGQATRLPWAWDGLCFAVPFNDATRDSARDLVANAAPSTATGLAWTRDNRGNVAAALDNSSYLEYPYNPQHNRPDTAVTVYARFRRTGTGDNAGAIIAKKISTSAPWVTWNIQSADGAPDYLTGYMSINSSSNVEFTMTYSLNTTDWFSAFVRWTTGTAPTIHLLNERGTILANAAHASTVSGSLTYAVDQPIYINANETTTGNYYADYSQVMVWSRRLSDTELQALVADPYGWYSPRRETVILAGPVPIVYATVFRVHGYAMFSTGTERDAMQAELQAWLDAHTAADTWASGHAVATQAGTNQYTLPAGIDTPDLMDEEPTPGGPWPGLTWSFEVATKELRDSFGSVPGLGTAWAGALQGSQFGETTT